MADIELVRCPLIHENIDVAYCIELQMIASKEILPTEDEKKFTESDWEVCRNCKKQKSPIPDIEK